MIRYSRTRTAKLKGKNLAQQQADFTAEGAPAPGLVASSVPVTAPAAAPTPPRVAARPARTPVRGAR